MPQFYPEIPANLQEWALAQPVFFTASAPLVGAHINVSPKGIPSSTLAVISPNCAAYLDATGSGCETISHVYENGRITLMWCSFGKSPRIMRWFCTGKVVEHGDPGWGEWRGRFKSVEDGGVPSARAVIVLDVWKVQTSCGFGVPLFSLSSNNSPIDKKSAETKAKIPDPEEAVDGTSFEERPTLGVFSKKITDKETAREYRKQWNYRSHDGLPGLRSAGEDAAQWLKLEKSKAALRRATGMKEGILLGLVIGIIFGGVLVRLLIHWEKMGILN